MSNYRTGIQKTLKGHKVVLYSADNGKLILAGESLERRIDAVKMANDLRDAFNNKRESMPMEPIECFPKNHKWPANKGPKKKAVVAEYTYKAPSVKALKKLAKKSPPHIKAWLGVPKNTKKK